MAKYAKGNKNQLWAVTDMDGKNILAAEKDLTDKIMAAFERQMESLLGSDWRGQMSESRRKEVNNSSGKTEADMIELAKKFSQQILANTDLSKAENDNPGDGQTGGAGDDYQLWSLTPAG